MIEFFIIGGALYMANKVSKTVAKVNNATFDQAFKKYAAQYGLDWKMLKAICMNESSLGAAKSVAEGLRNPSNIKGSTSSDGKSWGIMQLTIPTARDFDSNATEEKLNNPEYSVKLASQFIAWITQQFPSSDTRYTEWVVKSYNQGRGNTAKERRGEIAGYAGEYWERYKRNYALIKEG
jgi:membrane-bound lytic murein transglycosylase MltF